MLLENSLWSTHIIPVTLVLLKFAHLKHEICKLCVIQEWTLFIPVSWFEQAARMIKRSLCDQSKKELCVLLVLQCLAMSHTVHSGSCTMAMMKSQLVLLFFKLRYVTLSRCCKPFQLQCLALVHSVYKQSSSVPKACTLTA